MFDPVKSSTDFMRIITRSTLRVMHTQLELLVWFDELFDDSNRQVTSSEQEQEMIDARARHDAERKV